jgi:predicted lipoprotein with Yx(FWY)xxD motif
MRRSRIITAGIALAAVAAIGGVTAAAATGSPASSAPRAGIASAAPAAGPAAAAATVRAARATVAGTTETILVNGHGQPLYYYRPDTATTSLVTGGLARLWPPLTSTAPTAAGVTGKLTVVKDAHGDQVAYNGHLLYTFTSDHPGQVSGQGFQNFFVAAPGLAPLTNSTAPATTIPAAPSGGYGY